MQDFEQQTPKQEISIGWSTMLTLIIISVALSVFTTLMVIKFTGYGKNETVEILSFDAAALSYEAIQRYKDQPEKIDKAIVEAANKVKSMSQDGYVILDHRALLSAPSSTEIDVKTLLDSLEQGKSSAK